MARLDDPHATHLILGGHWVTPGKRSRTRPAQSEPVRPAGLSPHVLTLAEVQTRLGCGRSRVFELLGDGTLRRAKTPGKATLVTVASVETYEQRAMRPTAPKEPRPRPTKPPTKADLARRRADIEARRERLLRR